MEDRKKQVEGHKDVTFRQSEGIKTVNTNTFSNSDLQKT